MNATTEMRIESLESENDRLERALDEARNQRDEARELAADISEYHRIQGEIRQLIQQDGARAIDRPIYQLLWRDSEDIKNRHGGMPPKA